MSGMMQMMKQCTVMMEATNPKDCLLASRAESALGLFEEALRQRPGRQGRICEHKKNAGRAAYA